ncbi:MAG TPA: hypothetical protein VGG22_06770 [Candidatus Baltobacteraceae bacterium]|jgi:hypothetical protein
MEPRHFDQKDEDTNEAPWGPERRVKKQDFVKPGLREAIERYRLARAARHGRGTPDEPLGAIEPIEPIHPVRSIRERGI